MYLILEHLIDENRNESSDFGKLEVICDLRSLSRDVCQKLDSSELSKEQ